MKFVCFLCLKKAFFKFQLICLKSHDPNKNIHMHLLNLGIFALLFIYLFILYFRKVSKVESLNWTFRCSFVAEPKMKTFSSVLLKNQADWFYPQGNQGPPGEPGQPGERGVGAPGPKVSPPSSAAVLTAVSHRLWCILHLQLQTFLSAPLPAPSVQTVQN